MWKKYNINSYNCSEFATLKISSLALMFQVHAMCLASTIFSSTSLLKYNENGFTLSITCPTCMRDPNGS